MSNFTYMKYMELVSTINYLGEKLQKQTSDTYKSFVVEDSACQLISVANSLNAYIRHSKKAKK
jgi:hypothetical protein